MRLLILENKDFVGDWTANYVAKKINDFKPTADRPFVLGLPTGSTPLGMYKNLIRLNKENKVSFENVVTFNMDEYVGLDFEHIQSYHYFMYENFFNHINIKEENINILNGLADDLEQECQDYENKIKSYAGINLFIGGVGEDGHLAFNEPGSSLSSRTCIKRLTSSTINANSRFFDDDLDKVPKLALTVGVGTILEADEVLILAYGFNKADAVEQAVQGSINHLWTITALQMHISPILVIDEKAATELKVKTYNYFKMTEEENISNINE